MPQDENMSCPCMGSYGMLHYCTEKAADIEHKMPEGSIYCKQDIVDICRIFGEHEEFCKSLYCLCDIFRKSKYNEPNLVGRKKKKGTEYMR